MNVLNYLPRHWWSPRAWKTWGSFVHWRLETYGVYYPANRFNFAAFRSLLKQFPSYLKWLDQIEKSRQKNLHPGNN